MYLASHKRGDEMPTYKSNIPNQSQEEIQEDLKRLSEEFNANRAPEPMLSSEEKAEVRKLPITSDGITYEDSYEVCCKKVGRKADYYDTSIPHSRVWLSSNENCELLTTITFSESKLININRVQTSHLSIYTQIELGTLFDKYLKPIED